jgi:EAL domain-containing protein (putative c-di-GMP-specific phosphodiesterase class I)
VAVFAVRVFRTPRAAGSAAERLRRALLGSDLLLERAPVIDLLSGAIDHHAIATRLREDSSGLLERAERFGLGRQIDRRVVERALALVHAAEEVGADRSRPAWTARPS